MLKVIKPVFEDLETGSSLNRKQFVYAMEHFYSNLNLKDKDFIIRGPI